jgi:hypothetical protein
MGPVKVIILKAQHHESPVTVGCKRLGGMIGSILGLVPYRTSARLTVQSVTHQGRGKVDMQMFHFISFHFHSIVSERRVPQPGISLF